MAQKRSIRIGGLMRCCTQTVMDYHGEEVPGETRIHCKFTEESDDEHWIRLAPDGVWEWDWDLPQPPEEG